MGSTGSIGINTLNVIRRFPQHFEVLALSAHSNLELLGRQVREFSPTFAAVGIEGAAQKDALAVGRGTKILAGPQALTYLAGHPRADVVVVAMSGRAALEPFLNAAKSGKVIAPANKEALVIAGELIMAAAKKAGASIIPVDSEQSAIFQCLQGQRREDLEKIYLTASGGALRAVPASKFAAISVSRILKHPRWKMGRKITVDSATMMNKGFEVIEAQRLFSLKVDQIEVVVHPQAIVHSLVSFRDGSFLAQLGVTDMQLPIQYALTYPQRLASGLAVLDLVKLKRLTFAAPDFGKFPCLALAFEAARRAATVPAVLNAADEVAVDAFLSGRIRFTDIFKIVEKVVVRHRSRPQPSLDQIIAADLWARQKAVELISPRRVI